MRLRVNPIENRWYDDDRVVGHAILEQVKGVPPMDIVPLAPGFGAELRGIGLIDVASSAEAYSAVRGALDEHSVLLFRGQTVSDDMQAAYSRAFGPLEIVKVGS